MSVILKEGKVIKGAYWEEPVVLIEFSLLQSGVSVIFESAYSHQFNTMLVFSESEILKR
ncbi:MAG: hypothetical protein ACK40Q_00350 [Pseudothermotoga sp.]